MMTALCERLTEQGEVADSILLLYVEQDIPSMWLHIYALTETGTLQKFLHQVTIEHQKHPDQPIIANAQYPDFLVLFVDEQHYVQRHEMTPPICKSWANEHSIAAIQEVLEQYQSFLPDGD